MAEHSGIEWTDSTWNPGRGCTKVSPGCKHCCAAAFVERFRDVKGHPYEQGFKILALWAKWKGDFVNKDVFIETLYHSLTGHKGEFLKHN